MTLRSESSIHIVDLVSEGVITGFAGAKEDCVFLDDTPLSQYESVSNAVDLTLGGKNQRPPLNRNQKSRKDFYAQSRNDRFK